MVGERVVVGAPYDEVPATEGSSANPGQAFVYDLGTKEPLHQWGVPGGDPEAGGSFGHAVVALPAGRVAVAAPHTGGAKGSVAIHDVNSGERVRVLDETGTTWYGYGLARAGDDRLVVAAPRTQRHRGRVYVYDGRNFMRLAVLSAPNPTPRHMFGYGVDGDAQHIVVGVPGKVKEAAPHKAFLFDADSLAPAATLEEPTPHDEHGRFGYAVAVRGGLVAVAAPFATVDGVEQSGRVELFRTDGTHVRTLTSSEPGERFRFGRGVAISDRFVIVGAPGAKVGRYPTRGAVHFFDRQSGELIDTIESPNPHTDIDFGDPIRVYDEGRLLIGCARGGNDGRMFLYRIEGAE